MSNKKFHLVVNDSKKNSDILTKISAEVLFHQTSPFIFEYLKIREKQIQEKIENGEFNERLAEQNYILIDRILSKKNCPLVNLGLALYSHDHQLSYSIYEDGNSDVRCAYLRGNRLVLIRNSASFIDFATGASLDEQRSLLMSVSPYIRPILCDLFSRSEEFSKLPEDHYQWLVNEALSSPWLTRQVPDKKLKYESTNWSHHREWSELLDINQSLVKLFDHLPSCPSSILILGKLICLKPNLFIALSDEEGSTYSKKFGNISIEDFPESMTSECGTFIVKWYIDELQIFFRCCYHKSSIFEDFFKSKNSQDRFAYYRTADFSSDQFESMLHKDGTSFLRNISYNKELFIDKSTYSKLKLVTDKFISEIQKPPEEWSVPEFFNKESADSNRIRVYFESYIKKFEDMDDKPLNANNENYFFLEVSPPNYIPSESL